jgi:hypothetical protein
MKTSLGWVGFVGLISVGSLALLLPAGCQDRLYSSGETVSLIDGSASHADAARDQISGGDTGLGGRGGGAAGADGAAGSGGSGAGGAGATDGSTTTCDNSSPLRQTDVANCGTCFNECVQRNADAQCVAGVCRYTCLPGFFDADGMAANGCECTQTNGGTEICDGVDNDCNGLVDEGFNLMTDLANCGGCNRACYFPFAAATCAGGICSQGACLPDFYDRDPNVPGCETSCQKTNGGVEICDGLDNDCNGVVDDGILPATITCKAKGVCAGTLPVCHGTSGYTCTYPSSYQELEDTAKGCDGLDNDCDGLVDEPFGIGKSCIFGTGPCAGTGTWVCDNTQTGNRRCNGALLPSSPEVCDGKDNNCDGRTDELDKLSASNDTLVTFTTGSSTVTMFAYEASRNDATGAAQGFADVTHRPCSLGGKLPWSNITKEEAAASCVLVGSGWRLCADTEWLDACNGGANTTFPYGAAYVASSCNGYDYMSAAGAAPIPTGAAAACVSNLSPGATGLLYDMSGNLKEWVSTAVNSSCATLPCFQLRGGAYDIASFIDNSVTPAVIRAPGLQCDASVPAPASSVRLPSVGFRCCHTGALPP